MSVSKPTAMDAEELLSLLQRSISQVSTASRTLAAVDFVGESPTVGSNLSRSAQHLEAAAASFGSLPPSPPTFRGRIGLWMVGFINRLLWWQIAVFETVRGRDVRLCPGAGGRAGKPAAGCYRC